MILLAEHGSKPRDPKPYGAMAMGRFRWLGGVRLQVLGVCPSLFLLPSRPKKCPAWNACTLFIQVRAIAPSTDHPPGRKAQVSSRGRPVWCLWARPRESPSRNQGISCDSGRITTLLRGSSKKKGHTNFPRKPERGYWNILEPSHGKSCCLTCRNR